MHRLSNHLPSIIKNIPKNINKRLFSIRADEKMFKSVAPQFQDALKKNGYDHILKFDPSESESKVRKKSKNRAKRHILWYNATVGTNVGKEFVKLIDKCFPPSHPLHPIFNRKNMEKIISAKNTKVLKPPEPEKKSCSCTKNKECHRYGHIWSGMVQFGRVWYLATCTNQAIKFGQTSQLF